MMVTMNVFLSLIYLDPTRSKRPLYTDRFKTWDSPDGILWKKATDKEYFILEDKKDLQFWIKFKIKDIPCGKSSINVRWVFKLKYKMEFSKSIVLELGLRDIFKRRE
jgi:hypothetical protein